MSRYAWLVCHTCKVMVWLGKAAMKGADVEYIHPAGAAPDDEKQTLNCVIWKMFADHAGHALQMITDQSPAYASLEGYVEIGGDEDGDISFDAYLKDWGGEKTCK
ncbi:MAG: hypothetical protein JXA33_22660 [Anaerolineae bacterium]|nr:hypothetical protein [Anaerolineae bacterium]